MSAVGYDEKAVHVPEDPTIAKPYLSEPNYYRLAYQIIAQQQNGSLATNESDASTGTSGLGASVLDPNQLLLEVEQMLRWYRARSASPWWKFWVKKPTSRERRLCRFLDATVEPCVALVMAAAEARDESPRVSVVRQRAEQGDLSYRALYNLACFEASATLDRNRVTIALRYLQQALRKAPGDRRIELLHWAEADPALKRARKEPDFEKLRRVFGDLTAVGKDKQAH